MKLRLTGFLIILSISLISYLNQDTILGWFLSNVKHAPHKTVESNKKFKKILTEEASYNQFQHAGFKQEELRNKSLKRSEWLDNERDLYKSNLSESKYDFLVTPCQVSGGSFDKVTRLLASMYLADKLRQSGYVVPDVIHVSKALNDTYRRYKDDDIHDLAHDLNVKNILICKIGHNGKWGIRVKLSKRSLNNKNKFIQIGTRINEKYKFTTENIPSDIIYDNIENYLHKLNIDLTASQNNHDSTNGLGFIPDTYKELIYNKKTTPLQAAYNLQFLAQLYPSDYSEPKDRLLERSLIALKYVSPSAKDYKLLTARAYYYLHRRPRAMKIIESPQTPQEEAFKNYMNGNLTELVAITKSLNNDYHSQMSWIEVNGLYYRYFGKENEEYITKAHKSKQFRDFIYAKYSDEGVLWRNNSNSNIEKNLEDNFHGIRKTLDSLVKQNASLGKFITQEDIDALLKKNIDAIRENINNSNHPTWAVSKNELLDLYHSWMENNFTARMLDDIKGRSLPERALKKIEKLEKTFSGHPFLAYLKGRAFYAMLKTSPIDERTDLYTKHHENLYFATMWGDGQNNLTVKASNNRGDTGSEEKLFNALSFEKRIQYSLASHLYDNDYPGRSYWVSSPRIVQNRPEYRYQYSHASFNYYKRTVNKLLKLNDKDALTLYLDSNKDRYHGHPQLDLLNAKITSKDNDKEYQAQLEKIIETNHKQWAPYDKLSKLYFKKGEIKKSLDTILKYPGFNQNSNAGRIGLSHRSAGSAVMFFWKGYVKEASILFTKSLSYGTGSDSEYLARLRLSMIKNEYFDAAKHALSRANRYNSDYSYRDYISFLHVLGYKEQAWNAFSALIDRYESTELWTSSFIGHRVDKMTDNEITSWLKQPTVNTKKHNYLSKASRYAFMALSLDRKPSHDIFDVVNELNKGYEPTVVGWNIRNKIVEDKSYSIRNNQRQFMGPSGPMREDRSELKDIKVGDKIDSELAMFSKAYAYLKEKKYASAMKQFEHRGKYYTYNRATHGGYAMPYFAWASHKTGNTSEFKKLFNTQNRTNMSKEDKNDMDFYILLSRAMLSGGKGDHSQAIKLLKNAFHLSVYTQLKPIFISYEILELIELLYLDSQHEAYRALLVKWAGQYQQSLPTFSWLYSFEAKYTKNDEDRLRALAITLYLDSRSERISHFSKKEKANAEKWFKDNNPFIKSKKIIKDAA